MRVAVHGATGKLGRLIIEEAGERFAGAVGREGKIPACDVVIDVSSAAGLAALLPRLRGQPLLVGTTGDLPLADLERYGKGSPVALSANFSAGVPLLIELLKQAIPALPEGWDVEIVEAHHNEKKDAPSGTAKRLAAAVVEAGASTPTMHSLRVGDTVGEHTVWLCGPGERLELKHVATRRAVFAIGALRSAEWLVGQGPGFYRL